MTLRTMIQKRSNQKENLLILLKSKSLRNFLTEKKKDLESKQQLLKMRMKRFTHYSRSLTLLNLNSKTLIISNQTSNYSLYKFKISWLIKMNKWDNMSKNANSMSKKSNPWMIQTSSYFLKSSSMKILELFYLINHK